MARTSEWWPAFLAAHLRRHPRHDWPLGEAGAEFYDSWRKLFISRGVNDLDVAHEASERLVAEAPAHLGQHPAALCQLASAVYRERSKAGTPGLDLTTRDGVMADSRDCRICQGVGLVVRYRRRSLEMGKCPSITLYCTCSYGRWIKRTHAQESPDVRRRIYDLADHPWLSDDFTRPLSPEEFAGEDVPEALREEF
jgi:hypothetical protein